jgi:transposase InsO family protein
VERFHRTLKRWLDKQDPAATLGELQAQLDTFRAYYDEVRPHRAIGRRTPAEAYRADPRTIPLGRGRRGTTGCARTGSMPAAR